MGPLQGVQEQGGEAALHLPAVSPCHVGQVLTKVGVVEVAPPALLDQLGHPFEPGCLVRLIQLRERGCHLLYHPTFPERDSCPPTTVSHPSLAARSRLVKERPAPKSGVPLNDVERAGHDILSYTRRSSRWEPMSNTQPPAPRPLAGLLAEV